ncbi:hypothetical protein [Myxacorys almedinensis]|uniref:Uncharacterized protein n=1 Tax=Myxacorys almedinensis A TaxID=2690445 RepID=A0A8J7Z8F4_9CYAN|nr:hypothetical protein [Myxacorys almedinensis]NDJ19958.1 hypothetical protein [Myxacorys almedinensis A]
MLRRWSALLQPVALAIVGAAIFFLITIRTGSPVQAQISADSRLSRLETDLAGLRNQVNQLSANRAPSGRTAPTVQSPTRRQPASADPQFDRLATLVIELKERVTILEKQVTALKR